MSILSIVLFLDIFLWKHSEIFSHIFKDTLYSALSDLPSNIAFFCPYCAYDKNKEVCDVIETKLNSVQMELSNRFEDSTEKVNNLIAYSEQEPETTMVLEDTQSFEQVINRKQVTVESIASMTAVMVSEEK